jgi:hypothetical protein
MTVWDRRSSTFVTDRPAPNDPCLPSAELMSKAMEDFIESYLLTRGYPLSDANRERARKILGQHPEPNPDLIGSSAQERMVLLDRKMRIGFR